MSIVPESQPLPPLYTVKILLLGESSVGKSSIVNRYTNHTFESSGLLTIGIEVKKIMKQVAGKRVRLELWDTAGQEKYRTLPSQYYRGIQGILLVYDISNQQSFLRVEDWVQKIQDNCPLDSLAITLVGNKLDLEPQREVKPQTARLFAQQHQMHFQETSAKCCTNIEETVEQMLKDIMQKGLSVVKKDKLEKLELKSLRKQENDTCC